MSLNLGLSRLGVSRSGAGGVTLATGRVLNLDMTTGQDYSALSVTTSSAIGLIPVYAGDGVKTYVPKTDAVLAGWDGVRQIRNYIPGSIFSGTGGSTTNVTATHIGDGEYELTFTAGVQSQYVISGTSLSSNASATFTLEMRLISGYAITSIFPNRSGPGEKAITVTSTWTKYSASSSTTGLAEGIIIRQGSGGTGGVIRVRQMQLEDNLVGAQSVPSIFVNPTASAGWITDLVTGERAYHLGSGVALSWTKPGGSVDGNGVFTPALGDPISGVRWTGPKAATTTINAWSKPTPGTNGWVIDTATDLGSVPGPDGLSTSAQRISFSSGGQVYRNIGGTPASGYVTIMVKGTAGNKVNVYYGNSTNNYSCQFSLSGGWDGLSKLATINGTPAGSFLSLNTINTAAAGGANPTPSQSLDVFLLHYTLTPDAYIPTAGTNLTRLAETVAFPQTPGDNWTAVVGVNFSAGVPSGGSQRAIGFNSASKTPLYIGTLIATAYDGVGSFPTISVSTSTIKIGSRFNAKKLTLKTNTTLSSVSASDFDVGATTSVIIGSSVSGGNILGAPISTVKIWNRALSDVEFANG